MVARKVILQNDNKTVIMHHPLDAHFERIDNLLTEILTYLKEYPEDHLNEKPSPESWSALQVCHHLIKTEELSCQYLKKKLSFNPKLNEANMAAAMRLKLLKTYLNTPLKYKAPENIGTPALPVVSTFAEVESSWKAVRKDLRSFVTGLPLEILSKEVYKHPFAGRLSLEGMLIFFEEHMIRHFKQIKKALRKVV